jgi:hypothetical protein
MMAAAAASSDSDSEDKQPGGSAAAADDADPLVQSVNIERTFDASYMYAVTFL